MNSRSAAVAAALFGLLAVAVGAFGAHALKTRLAPEALAIVDTAVRYQMFHALALFAAAWVAQLGGGRAARFAAASFAVGIVLFSGSLYGLALGGATLRWLGPVTPLGGLAFLVGWAALGLAALRVDRA